MICFQISIFEPLETTLRSLRDKENLLWFAFKLVSLNHWKQRKNKLVTMIFVVICFQISIFEPLETTLRSLRDKENLLWFAFKLVSLNHWKQRKNKLVTMIFVVICFQISIFEPLETTCVIVNVVRNRLWFAFKLVSLNHWKQRIFARTVWLSSCDLLSN